MEAEKTMKRTGNSKLAVVGWGRGMGHTGHMYLADAVIAQAKAMNADPYFFISKTVGKDDPLYPAEKVHIYQRVFPKYAKIFEPQGNLNQALTDLAGLGYQGVIVVVGADQKQAFQYLEKPNKEGVPVYQSMGLKKLKVISRQETNSKYANEEGPRATPMREILMNPNASEQDKFAVWRRDMPQALGDQEVLDLMHKAEERMKIIKTQTKKLKEFIEKARPLLKEADNAKRLKVLKFVKESLNTIKNEAYEYMPPGAGYTQTMNIIKKNKPVSSQFLWKKPNQISGSFTDQQLISKGFKKSAYGSWGGTQKMWDNLLSVTEQQNPLIDLTPNFPNYSKLVGEFIGVQNNKIALRIVSAELKPGTKPTEKIAKAMAANRPITMAPNYVKNRTVVADQDENLGESVTESVDYLDEK